MIPSRAPARPCREVEDLLGRASASLTEAQRLALELHLSRCEACRTLHALSRGLGNALRGAGAELSQAARERAISGAFAAAGKRHSGRPGTPWVARALVAAAALVALAFGLREVRERTAWVESARGETRQFAHAQVTLSAGAQVRFAEAESTLELAHGEVDVNVDPRPHAPFRVQTANFRVEVLGTAFRVSERSVRVEHGHVRIYDRETQLADLHAGDRYDHATRRTTRAPVARSAPSTDAANAQASAPAPSAVSVERVPSASGRAAPRSAGTRAPAARRAGTRSGEGLAETRPPASDAENAKAEVPVQALLEEARGALARDDLERARGLVAQAEKVAQKRGERAEAGTLRAEIALRQRDDAGAVRAYLAVAERFGDLQSGENAAFAAAQLALRVGRPDARALLERYLAKYPQGSFADEARARLAR